jgi:hypothetical protein
MRCSGQLIRDGFVQRIERKTICGRTFAATAQYRRNLANATPVIEE